MEPLSGTTHAVARPANGRANAAVTPLDLAVITLTAVALCGPIWWYRYAAPTDAPSHASGAAALWNYLAGGSTFSRFGNSAANAIFRRYYAINPRIEANFPDHLILAALIQVMPAAFAVKTIDTICVLEFVMVCFWAGGINGHRAWIVALLSPFAVNYLFCFGFFNFSLSLPLFIWVVCYWQLHKHELYGLRLLSLALGALIVFFLHLSTFLAAVLAVFSAAAFDLARAMRQSDSVRFRSAACDHLISPFLAFLPGLSLVASFEFHQGLNVGDRVGFVEHLKRFVTIDVTYAFVARERLVGVLLFCFFSIAIAVSLVKRNGRKRTSDGLLFATVILSLAYFRAPEGMSGGYFVSHRLNLFPFLSAALWLLWEQDTAIQRGAMIVGLTCLWSLTLMRLPAYAAADEIARDATTVAQLVTANSTFMLLRSPSIVDSLSSSGMKMRVPVASGVMLTADRRVVDLSNYEMSSMLFPLIYRAPNDATGCIVRRDGETSWWNPTVGARIDYLFVILTAGGDVPDLGSTVNEHLREYRLLRRSARFALFGRSDVPQARLGHVSTP